MLSDRSLSAANKTHEPPESMRRVYAQPLEAERLPCEDLLRGVSDRGDPAFRCFVGISRQFVMQVQPRASAMAFRISPSGSSFTTHWLSKIIVGIFTGS